MVIIMDMGTFAMGCLNYELDTYLDALKDFPKKDIMIKTKNGIA